MRWFLAAVAMLALIGVGRVASQQAVSGVLAPPTATPLPPPTATPVPTAAQELTMLASECNEPLQAATADLSNARAFAGALGTGQTDQQILAIALQIVAAQPQTACNGGDWVMVYAARRGDPLSAPGAPVAAPAAQVSPLAQTLATQIAQQCTGMTADQIIAKTQAVVAAFRQAGGNATVEQILYLVLATPNLLADVHTCNDAIESAAMADGLAGALPLPTVTPAQ